MAQQGGYRKPENPAPMSGPGALSRRTDGGPAQGAKYISGLPYGQGQSTYDQQTAAPMAAASPMPSAPAAAPIEMPTPLMAPTSRPNEPITAGINMGAGPGSEVMMDRPSETKTITDTLRELIRFDPSGDTELIYRTLVDEGY
jgi:hypothetical protein